MCGRYTLAVIPEQLAEEFELTDGEPFSPRYNIAPTQSAPIIRRPREDGPRELAVGRWGLIPHWAKDPSIGSRLINARSETAAEKPAFRQALRRQRCLIPCTGFFEWKVLDPTAKKPTKQPFYIRRRDERVFALAGLWDRWRSPENDPIDSFTILTTEPNELLRTLHDRMPVIVPREGYDIWLDLRVQEPDRLAPLLRPFPADPLAAFPVSTRVNNPRFDDPSCIRAAGPGA